jgi:hypothetical protein
VIKPWKSSAPSALSPGGLNRMPVQTTPTVLLFLSLDYAQPRRRNTTCDSVSNNAVQVQLSQNGK